MPFANVTEHPLAPGQKQQKQEYMRESAFLPASQLVLPPAQMNKFFVDGLTSLADYSCVLDIKSGGSGISGIIGSRVGFRSEGFTTFFFIYF